MGERERERQQIDEKINKHDIRPIRIFVQKHAQAKTYIPTHTEKKMNVIRK